MSIEVESITFSPEGLSMQYMDTEEIRVSGKVIVVHQINLRSTHPDYRDDAARLQDLARSVVRNALADWAATPPHREEEDDDDDDSDLGMGE